MVKLEELTRAALAGEALRLRSLVQDWLRENPRLVLVAKPSSMDSKEFPIAAGLAELLASRRGEPPPPWAADVGPAAEDIFLLKEALNMKRLRALCLEQSPLPLRRRRIYAPPGFLESV